MTPNEYKLISIVRGEINGTLIPSIHTAKDALSCNVLNVVEHRLDMVERRLAALIVQLEKEAAL